MKRDKERRIKIVDTLSKQITGEWGSDSGNEEEKVCVLRTTNFRNDCTVNYTNVVTRYVNPVKIESKKLIPGDIILEKSGGSDNFPVGRVVYFEHDGVYLCNNFTHTLRTDDSIINPRYLVHNMSYLYHCGVTKQYQSKTTGIRNLKVKDYLNVEIPLPPLDVQRRIADTLDKVTELITLRKTQLEKLDEMVKARFVEMFGGISDSKIYPYKAVKELTDVISGGTPSREVSEYWEGGTIPWVKTTELQNNIITEIDEHITEAGLDNSSAKLVPAGTVLIAMYGQGRTRGMTGYLGVEACTNQACACILPSDGINQRYLWQYFVLSYDNLRDMAKGGNQPNLNGNIIKNYPILYPPMELQNQFVAFVEQTDKSKVIIQQSLYTLETLKKSLMQEYFG